MDISVIVPVFNLEDYIEKTIRSIQRQRFNGSIEIVIVDDGSTDNSLSIVQRISEIDQQVKIISQKNSGVSAARNVGLEAACGKYVLFVDGDDILCEDAVEKLVNGLEKHEDAIISCGDLKRIDSQDDQIPSTGNAAEFANSDQIIARILAGQYEVSACAKLFVRDKIAGIRFVEGKRINEDKCFFVQYLIRNHGIVVTLNDYVYGYYVRTGSASNSLFSEKTLDMIYFSV